MYTRLCKGLWLFSLIFLVGCSYTASTDEYPRLSSQSGRYTRPHWSKDGTSLLFEFEPVQALDTQFVSARADGEDWQQLQLPKLDAGEYSDPQWWNDHEIMYMRKTFTPDTSNLTSDIAVYNLVQEQETLGVAGSASIISLSASPSGNQVAFSEATSADHYVLQLYDFATDEVKTLYDPPPSSWVEEVAWSHQDNRVAYTLVTDSGDVAVRNSSTLEILDVQTGERTTLYGPTTQTVDSPTWSPTGEWIAVRIVDNEYQGAVLLLKTDGSSQRTIPLPVSPVDLAWSPVDNTVAVTTLGLPRINEMYLIDFSPWLETDLPVTQLKEDAVR